MESVKNQQTKNIYYWPLERDEILNLNGNRVILNDLINIIIEANNIITEACTEELPYLSHAAGKKSILKTQKQGESKPLRGITSKKVTFKLPENKTASRTQKPSRIPIFIGSKPAYNVSKISSTKKSNYSYPHVIKSTHSMTHSDQQSYVQENQFKADQIASSSQSSYFNVNDTTYKESEQHTAAEKKSILKKQVPEEYKHLPIITKPSAKKVSFKLPENEIATRTQKPSRIPILMRSKPGLNHIREPIHTKNSITKTPRSSCLSQSSPTDGDNANADNVHNTKSMNSTPSTASSVKCAAASHQNNSSSKASKIEFQIYRAVFGSSGVYLEQIFLN